MAERLLIMRHGEAGHGRPDAARELTGQGDRETARMACWLAAREEPDLTRLRLLVSPYVRARQTAERIAEPLGLVVETLPIITPDDPPEAVVEWLLEQPEGRPMMLVSHMPLVAALTGLLVEGRVDRGPGFPTAAVAELEAEVWAAGCARLARFTAPADLD
ncbi:phosphohistidine phosphatase SixA [Halomonas rhizosphaerae]|uniref:Phosphohistidine phosphatase SixA n=1 Tax=Halomonas rhizosphaerae TaxID=3043296 RepID=A0ABT6UXS7_9GAMM|nr:phosphohistidine phosphatase SixA [Halomonas rhizosphaerae]MDI5890775.1 phosphohistidine phosphatase SixA [Halomonas rhizosphaerae]MDI5921662.1 phosphohistidine phosphatase SixA [Halomonas rhizosphaerae]